MDALAGSLDESAVNLVASAKEMSPNLYPCRYGIIADATNMDEFGRVGVIFRMTFRQISISVTKQLYIYIYIYIYTHTNIKVLTNAPACSEINKSDVWQNGMLDLLSFIICSIIKGVKSSHKPPYRLGLNLHF